MTYKAVSRSHTKLILPQGSDMPQLVCSLDIPCPEEHPHITEFYSRLSNACADYCRGELLSRCAALQSDPRYPLLYRLSCRVSEENGDITVSLRVCLSDSRTHRSIVTRTQVHRWKESRYLRVVRQTHS